MASDSHPRRVFTQRTAALADGTGVTHTHAFNQDVVVLGVRVRCAADVTFTLSTKTLVVIGPDGVTPAEWNPTDSPVVPELPGGPLIMRANDELQIAISNDTGAPVDVASMVHTVRLDEWRKLNDDRGTLLKALVNALPKNAA